MAVRLLSKSKVVLLYNSSLRSVAQGLQSISSGAKWGPGLSPAGYKDDNLSTESMEPTVWPDPNLGLLGPKDKRLALPGNIGLSQELAPQKKLTARQVRKTIKEEDNILTCQLPDERHRLTVGQAFNPDDLDDDYAANMNVAPPTNVILECVAQECPKLLQKDFSDLFPTMFLTTGPLTVVTLCQKTLNDMSAWSEAVDLEREELMLYFVIAAEEICAQLTKKGFWADFIDPSSGRPYLGDYTSATLFETDERYRHFGFTIEDLGCCKVIRHGKWNTNVFVGCLFTNAPVNGPQIQAIIDRHTTGNLENI